MLVFMPQYWQYGYLTFGYLSAQQISSIIFQCSALYHTEFDILWLFIHRSREYRSFHQRVSSPTTSSPTYEVDSPTSNVSSPTLICQLVRKPTPKILFRLPRQGMKERGRSCMACKWKNEEYKLYGVNCWVHIFSGLFGSAVDKRTRNNWYACKDKKWPCIFCSLAALVNWYSTLANQLHTLANWSLAKRPVTDLGPGKNVFKYSATDAKTVRSRDAQCNTEESP